MPSDRPVLCECCTACSPFPCALSRRGEPCERYCLCNYERDLEDGEW